MPQSSQNVALQTEGQPWVIPSVSGRYSVSRRRYLVLTLWPPERGVRLPPISIHSFCLLSSPSPLLPKHLLCTKHWASPLGIAEYPPGLPLVCGRGEIEEKKGRMVVPGGQWPTKCVRGSGREGCPGRRASGLEVGLRVARQQADKPVAVAKGRADCELEEA